MEGVRQRDARDRHGLQAITGYAIRGDDIVAELMISGNSFVIVLSPPRTSEQIDREALAELVSRVEDAHPRPSLRRRFRATCSASSAATLDAATRRVSREHPARAARPRRARGRARTIVPSGEAEATAERSPGCGASSTGEHPHARAPGVRPRRPRRSSATRRSRAARSRREFERPDKLFSVAYDADLVMRLERLCRKRRSRGRSRCPTGRCSSSTSSPRRSPTRSCATSIVRRSSLEAAGALAADIVLEITERTAIVDFSAFRSTLEYLRALGFAIAVDDAGAGYGSLQCLAEVRPEWLKIDLSLMRGVDSDEVRRPLIESLVTFSTNVGSKLIAEGIETEAELATLRALGRPLRRRASCSPSRACRFPRTRTSDEAAGERRIERAAGRIASPCSASCSDVLR